MVIWIIGLSASGKSTLAEKVVFRLRESGRKVAFLDGDDIRQLFGNDVDYSVAGRYRNAQRLSQLTAFLSGQGIDVVAAVLSIFPEWQQWNRANIPGYFEVYVKVSMETLRRREVKGIYSLAYAGEMENVVGVDIDFPEPTNAHLVIDNEADRQRFDDLVDKILQNASH